LALSNTPRRHRASPRVGWGATILARQALDLKRLHEIMSLVTPTVLVLSAVVIGDIAHLMIIAIFETISNQNTR